MTITEVKIPTREQWLRQAVVALKPLFSDAAFELPEVHVSCGWPSTKGLKSRIGECWHPASVADGHPQIFISPKISDPVRVLDVLVHELIHACLPEAQHGKDFRDAMKDLGLIGKPTATVAGEDLGRQLAVIAEILGAYPNAAINPLARPADAPKPQKNRQIKASCTRVDDHEDGEEYILRAARSTWERGIPDCPLCGNELVIEEPEDEQEKE